MLGGSSQESSRNPINDKYFSVKDLLTYTRNDIQKFNELLQSVNVETTDTWMKVNSFIDVVKERALTQYVKEEWRTYEFPVEDALEIYGNPKKYGQPGPSKGTDWEDLKLLKEEIVMASNDIDTAFNSVGETTIEDPEVTGLVLKGHGWLQEVNKKLDVKLNNLPMWVLGRDAYDFEDFVNSLIANGEFNYDTPSSSGSRGRRSRSSSRRSRRGRSRGSSRSSSRSSRGRPRSRSRPRTQGSSSRSGSRSSSDGITDLEMRLTRLQQTPQQQNSNSSERRRRMDRENANFSELERRFTALQQRPVARRLFD